MKLTKILAMVAGLALATPSYGQEIMVESTAAGEHQVELTNLHNLANAKGCRQLFEGRDLGYKIALVDHAAATEHKGKRTPSETNVAVYDSKRNLTYELWFGDPSDFGTGSASAAVIIGWYGDHVDAIANFQFDRGAMEKVIHEGFELPDYFSDEEKALGIQAEYPGYFAFAFVDEQSNGFMTDGDMLDTFHVTDYPKASVYLSTSDALADNVGFLREHYDRLLTTISVGVQHECNRRLRYAKVVGTPAHGVQFKTHTQKVFEGKE